MRVWDMSSFDSFCLFGFNLTIKIAYEAGLFFFFLFFSAFADAFMLCLPKDRPCLCESDAGEFRSWRKRWISVVMQKR